MGHQSSSVASGVSVGGGGVGEGGEGSVSSGVGDGEVSRGERQLVMVRPRGEVSFGHWLLYI